MVYFTGKETKDDVIYVIAQSHMDTILKGRGRLRFTDTQCSAHANILRDMWLTQHHGWRGEQRTDLNQTWMHLLLNISVPC